MKKKIITSFVSYIVMLAFTVGMTANASNYSYIIDNDPIASGMGYSHTSNMTYYNATGSYNQDMRISSELSSSSNVMVQYSYPSIVSTSTQYIRLSVYLNNINFTDESAWYLCNISDSTPPKRFNINQNTAVGGWNDLYWYAAPSYFNASIITGYGSKNYNQYFGSDAVKITVYY